MIVDSPPHVHDKLGLSEEQINIIRQDMVKHGIRSAAKHISRELLEHFIVLGNDEECAREIARLMSAYPFDVFTVPVPVIKDVNAMLRRVSKIIERAKELYNPRGE